MTYLIFVSDKCTDETNAHRIASTDGVELWVRAELYRGVSDPVEYGDRHERPGEIFVNSVNVPTCAQGA